MSTSSQPQQWHEKHHERNSNAWENSSINSNSSSQFEKVIEGHKKKMKHVERQSLYDINAQKTTPSQSHGGHNDFIEDHKKKMKHVERQNLYQSNAQSAESGLSDGLMASWEAAPLNSPSVARHRSSTDDSTTAVSESSLKRKTTHGQLKEKGLAPENQYEVLLKGHKKKMHHVERQSLYAYNTQLKLPEESNSESPRLSSTAEGEEENDEYEYSLHSGQGGSNSVVTRDSVGR